MSTHTFEYHTGPVNPKMANSKDATREALVAARSYFADLDETKYSFKITVVPAPHHTIISKVIVTYDDTPKTAPVVGGRQIPVPA